MKKNATLLMLSFCLSASIVGFGQMIKKTNGANLAQNIKLSNETVTRLGAKKTSNLSKSPRLQAEGDCEIVDFTFDFGPLYTTDANGDNQADGYVVGTNPYGDLQKANYFNFSDRASNNYINGLIVFFGDAFISQTGNATKIVPIRVFDGTGGIVGAELGHSDIVLKDIIDSVDKESYNPIDFANVPLPASKEVFVSVDLSNLTYGGEFLAVASSEFDGVPENTAWEQAANKNWYSFPASWGGKLSLAMIPLIGVSDGCTQIVAPVTLSSFSANRFGTANKLTWTTVSESASKGFEVQRSADGVNFTTIAFVPSQSIGGNSTATLNYSYADNAVLPNNNYYRIKQIDLTAKATFTKTLLLFTDKLKKEGIVQAYPNPVKNNLNLILDLGASKNNTLTVIDLAGRTLLQKSVQGSNGNQTTTLNVANLAKGTYFVKLTGEGNKKLVKFIKE